MPSSMSPASKFQIASVSGTVRGSNTVALTPGYQVMVYVSLDDDTVLTSTLFPVKHALVGASHLLSATYNLVFPIPTKQKSFFLGASYVTADGQGTGGSIRVLPTGWADPIAVGDKNTKDFEVIEVPPA